MRGSEVRDLIAQLERRYRWASLDVDGRGWRWLDTQAAGPAVVLLPGSIGDAAMFVRPLLALGERLRMVAVTYPDLSDPKSLARGLEAVVDHLGLPRSIVVGSSFGAYWAQFFALACPSRVRHLVIGNGFVDNIDFDGQALFARSWVEHASSQDVHTQWLARVQSSPESELRDLQLLMLGERQSPQNLHARFLGVARASACPPLSLGDADITVLDCSDDPLIERQTQHRLAARYSGAERVNLQHGGHYPHVINSAAYNQVLVRVCL